MFTKFGFDELESAIDCFFNDQRYRFHINYFEGMRTGAKALAEELCEWPHMTFETELRCAYAAIVEETRIRFHDRYQGDYAFRRQSTPTYDCKEENIKKARNKFEPLMERVSFEEIYKNIARDKKDRYLQKHGMSRIEPDIDKVLA